MGDTAQRGMPKSKVDRPNVIAQGATRRASARLTQSERALSRAKPDDDGEDKGPGDVDQKDQDGPEAGRSVRVLPRDACLFNVNGRLIDISDIECPEGIRSDIEEVDAVLTNIDGPGHGRPV